MGAVPAPTDALLAELGDALGPAGVVTDPEVVAGAVVDWTGRFRGAADALVRPGSLAEVEAVVAAARRHGVALVPQGGNTGLVGGSVPLHGEVLVQLGRLDEVEPVDTTSGSVVAGAGATLERVQAAARAAGLRYAVDLAARGSATVGGTVATNAGGLAFLRHGGTREQLLGVEAVLGTGAAVRRLHDPSKDNTGYHLPSLLCGSEGTLGLITAVRLRLVPDPPERVVALVALGTVAGAVEATAALRRDLPELEAAELVLPDGLALVCRASGLPHPLPAASGAGALLLLEAVGEGAADRLGAAVLDLPGTLGAAVAADAAGRARLWRYREDHTLAINTLGPPHKLDVALPLGALAELVEAAPSLVAAVAPDASTWCFGHVGDGNVHVNVTGVDPGDDRVDEAVLRRVAELGGSISAEHGIGTAKRRWLHLTRSSAEIAAMRALRRALDPDGILHPHALLPEDAP
jgi:FAD/FMN-containing dehydrogenase